MTTLETLLRLVDAIGDDYLHRSHPSAWPRESLADRLHDQTRPDDPTADAATDPVRMALSAVRSEAWQIINRARRRPYPKAPLSFVDEAWARLVVEDLSYAWDEWHGSSMS